MKKYLMFILYSLLRSAVTYGLFIVVVSLISLESTLIFGRLISCAVSVGALLLWCGYTYGYVCKLKRLINDEHASKPVVISVAILLGCVPDAVFLFCSVSILLQSLGMFES